MTFDLVVTLVSLVFLVLVMIDCQHDANHVLYVKALWPRAFSGDQAWTCYAGYFLILVVRDDLNKTCIKLMRVHLVHLIM